jgi:hypothetical protein
MYSIPNFPFAIKVWPKLNYEIDLKQFVMLSVEHSGCGQRTKVYATSYRKNEGKFLLESVEYYIKHVEFAC